MNFVRFVVALGVTAAVSAAQTPLPDLRVEAADAGSVLYVKNRASQAMTAFLIELVDYPGSTFTYSEDNLAGAIAPGAEKRIPVSNMLPGAVPDSVRMQAAIFADGSTAGAAEKVERLVERRRTVLQTTREAVRRMSAGTEKGAIVAELRRWAESLRPGPARGVVEGAIDRLGRATVAEVLDGLQRSEAALAGSKPPL